MKKSEILAKIINVPVEIIENEFDSGMLDILIELNKKNYLTAVCCEGHLNENKKWNGYIGFIYPYNFTEYPPSFNDIKNRQYYYWCGYGEESRREFLNKVLNWAKSLPKRELVEIKTYTLYGRKKRHRKNNNKFYILKHSKNYEDIKAYLNKADIPKYEIEIKTNVVGVY